MEPYYSDESVRLYHGDCREVIQDLTEWFDAVVTDPPYGETSLPWDRWVDKWPLLMTWHTNSMWCFGSMRMFLERSHDFRGWKLSQDVVWEKQNGTGFAADRFRRVHEHAVHWYQGDWSSIYRQVPKVAATGRRGGDVLTRTQPTHTDAITAAAYVDDGLRLQRSVMAVRNSNHQSLHPTEKPIGILRPLIEYSTPPGGSALDPFAGSGSTGVAAVLLGRRAVLIEADERYCEIAARRLSQGVLDFEGAS